MRQFDLTHQLAFELCTIARGGTDGARLSFAGIPCPNLGIGGWAYHSPKEHIPVEIMNRGSRVLEEVMMVPKEKFIQWVENHTQGGTR